MEINESILQEEEKIILSLRELYLKYGYEPYRMSKFEEYDLYARNKDYLISDNVITFTDTNGKLMALKPDVTLSIIKNSKDDPASVRKVFYNENVYRVSKGTNAFKEIMQAGLEVFGGLNADDVCEVISLAALSLKRLSPSCVLNISNLSIIKGIVDSFALPKQADAYIYKLIDEKNIHELDRFLAESNVPSAQVEILKDVLKQNGSLKDVLPEFKNKLSSLFALNPELLDINDRFFGIMESVAATDTADIINIDFSTAGDINYYNGIIFNGFIEGVPGAVLSGGQYDTLMQKMGRRSKAIGFAVYMDALERLDPSRILSKDNAEDDRFINVALPKGRLGEKVYELFAKAGYECPSLLEPGRKLIFENEERSVRYFWVKPSDVAIYVERGAADIGVCGKDILLEYEPSVYELLDLNMGKCRMAVAAPKDFKDDVNKTLRVATKFSNTARNFYQSKGRNIDIIHLNGSIEIAPILKLSDVIVDIVETGTTLKENNLEIFEEINPISARLISNKSSYEFKGEKIKQLTERLANISITDAS